jgi:hypothetical protein
MIKSNKFYNFFFDANKQQKQWFVLFGIFLPLILTIIFSIWGTIISVRSYNLSEQESQNKEQLDTLTSMIKELRKQNILLLSQNSVMDKEIDTLSEIAGLNRFSNTVQYNHFSSFVNGIRDSKIPKLAIEDVNSELVSGGKTDFSMYYAIKIVNYGGDIYNLRFEDIDSSGLDKGSLPKNGFVPKNSNLEFEFENLFLFTNKKKLVLKFYFNDNSNIAYQQDLIILNASKNNDEAVEYQLGKLCRRK